MVEASETSKSLAQAHHLSSLFKSLKTSHLSQLSTIPEHRQRQEALVVEAAQSSEAAASVVSRNEAAVVVSRDKAKVNRVVKARTNSSIREVVVEVAEAGALAGATMTSHRETETLRSLFVLAGP